MAAEWSGGLQAALDELLKEEHAKEGKKKPAFRVPVEKRLQYYSGWDRKDKRKDAEKVVAMDEEIGRVKKSDTTDVVVRVDDFGGKRGVTIREYLTSEKYTGFTKQGTRIPAEKWEEFKAVVNKVKV